MLVPDPHHAPEAARQCRRGVDNFPWRRELPVAWSDMALPPLAFNVFREPELLAERVFGYDEDGQACFYSHCYALQDTRSDDGESFYTALAYAEQLRAWKLRDGRWLIQRQVSTDGEPAGGRRFHTFSEEMPR